MPYNMRLIYSLWTNDFPNGFDTPIPTIQLHDSNYEIYSLLLNG